MSKAVWLFVIEVFLFISFLAFGLLGIIGGQTANIEPVCRTGFSTITFLTVDGAIFLFTAVIFLIVCLVQTVRDFCDMENYFTIGVFDVSAVLTILLVVCLFGLGITGAVFWNNVWYICTGQTRNIVFTLIITSFCMPIFGVLLFVYALNQLM